MIAIGRFVSWMTAGRGRGAKIRYLRDSVSLSSGRETSTLIEDARPQRLCARLKQARRNLRPGEICNPAQFGVEGSIATPQLRSQAQGRGRKQTGFFGPVRHREMSRGEPLDPFRGCPSHEMALTFPPGGADCAHALCPAIYAQSRVLRGRNSTIFLDPQFPTFHLLPRWYRPCWIKSLNTKSKSPPDLVGRSSAMITSGVAFFW